MSEIGKWLESIGPGRYTGAFEANHIDVDLPQLVDDQALEDIRCRECWPQVADRPAYSDRRLVGALRLRKSRATGEKN